jgi:hypothetical protein
MRLGWRRKKEGGVKGKREKNGEGEKYENTRTFCPPSEGWKEPLVSLFKTSFCFIFKSPPAPISFPDIQCIKHQRL